MLHARTILAATLLAAVSVAGSARAQQGQRIQLPTFKFFGVQTTVSVPDRGGAYMGGVRRSASGSSSHGVPGLGGPLFRNRGIGRSQSAGGVGISATIIDHAELDRAVLAEGAARHRARMDQLGATERRSDYLSRNITRNERPALAETRREPPGAGLPTAEDIRRRNALAQSKRADEAIRFYEKGRTTLAGGKANVAKIYFQMAQRRAQGPLLEQVTAQLNALDSAHQIAAGTSR